MICPVCKACKGVTLVDIGAGFINTEVVCGGGVWWGGVHCSFTSCLPTLCPLLPRITPRLLKICHDVGVVVLWCCGAVVVVLTSAGPGSSPPPRRRLIFSSAVLCGTLQRTSACSRGDTHDDV